jgi:6-phosphogluconolactonase
MALLEVYPDAERLAEAAADHIVRLAAKALAARSRFALALAGGSTPHPMYERLAARAGAIDWARTQLLFGDERCVPAGDARSNYAMVHEALLERAGVPAANVHRIRGEDDPGRAAHDYEDLLERVLGAAPLDLVLLGLGEDGHTASLFPGSPLLDEARRRVAAEYVEAAGMWRITLTPVAINAARHVAFLVSGANKAAMLQRVLEGPRAPARLPAQIVQPAQGELRWLVDASAAAMLSRATRRLLSPA